MSEGLRIVMASIAVLCLPGLAVSYLLGRGNHGRIDLITSIGLSLSMLPLAALLMTLLQVRFDRSTLFVGGAICFGLVLLKRLGLTRRQLMRSGPRASRVIHPARSWRLTRKQWIVLGLSIVFAATLILRFIQIRELVLPAWVDSLHHTQIVDTIREQGRVPDVLMSYASIPFYYHFGFHAVAAAFAELAELSSARAVLVLGQILNAMASLAVYRLAVTLTRRPTVGLVAAVFTGLVSQMPAYFVSWGRYTLLTGMILLPLVMSAAVELWWGTARTRYGWPLAVLVAGLILTHYLAAAYFGCFLLALMLVEGPGHRLARAATTAAAGRSKVTLVWTGVGIVMVAPWIIHVALNILPSIRIQTGASLIETARVELLDRVAYTLSLSNPPHTWPILLLAVASISVSLTKRQSTRLLVMWVVLLAMLSNEWLWRIWPFRADLLLICLFLPINVLGASGLLQLQRPLELALRSPLRSQIALTLGLIAFALCGALDTRSIVNPATILATSDDVAALAWIEHDSAPDARFLINVERWQGKLYRGTDGGWWIPLLSHRMTVLPPGIFYGWTTDKHVISAVEQVAEQIRIIDGCTPYFWYVIHEQHITHIYVGDGDGALQPAWLDQCVGVTRVYRNAGVSIYQINDGSDSAGRAAHEMVGGN